MEGKYRFCLLIIILQCSWQNTGLLFEELNFIQVNETVDCKLIKCTSVYTCSTKLCTVHHVAMLAKVECVISGGWIIGDVLYCSVICWTEGNGRSCCNGTCKRNCANVLLFVHCSHAMSDIVLTVVDNCYWNPCTQQLPACINRMYAIIH